MIYRVIITGFQWKRSKNSQNHLYGQLDGFSLLSSSSKFAVRAVRAVWIIIIIIIIIKIMNFVRVSCLIAQTQCFTDVWMNVNRVKLQHDRELTMIRFYFPFIVVLCDIYARHFEYSCVRCFVIRSTENNFKMNLEARISLRAFFLQPKA